MRSGKYINFLHKVNMAIVAVTRAVIEVLFAVLIAIISLNVILRYVFKKPLFWVTEFSCYCLVYIVFLGAALALYYGEHVRVNINYEVLPDALRRILRYMRVVLNYSFLIAMIVVGFALAFSNMDSFTGSLPIPMGCIYLAAPISALLMLPLYMEYVLIERGKN